MFLPSAPDDFRKLGGIDLLKRFFPCTHGVGSMEIHFDPLPGPILVSSKSMHKILSFSYVDVISSRNRISVIYWIKIIRSSHCDFLI